MLAIGGSGVATECEPLWVLSGGEELGRWDRKEGVARGGEEGKGKQWEEQNRK